MKKIIRTSTIPSSIYTFLNGQLEELSKDYEIVVISSNGEALDKILQRDKVRVIGINMERHISIFKDIVSLLKMINILIKEKPDIVHSMTPKAGLITMLAGFVTRVPIRIHTFTGLVFPTSNGIKKRILILIDKLICYCATYINPEGQGIKNDLINYCITSKELHVIANGNVRGINKDYYCSNEDLLKKALDLKEEGTFVFSFVGRLVSDKGVNELVLAFSTLYKKNNNLRLQLIGPFEDKLDPLNKKTIMLIKSHKGIIYRGRQDDVRPFLLLSDVFVFPSYREGFPNVVLEAGAMGLPCIVTDINGSNEIIKNKVNGLIIKPRDKQALEKAMLYCIDNREDLSLMASKAREMVISKFEQKIILEALKKEYEMLLAK